MRPVSARSTFFQNPLQGRFIEYNDVVQALPPQRSHEALRVWILLRGSGCCQHFANTHFLNSLMEGCVVKVGGTISPSTRKHIDCTFPGVLTQWLSTPNPARPSPMFLVRSGPMGSLLFPRLAADLSVTVEVMAQS